MKISENQRIASVKTKLELEKEEAVKKVKEEMKVCDMWKVFIIFPRDLHETKYEKCLVVSIGTKALFTSR